MELVTLHRRAIEHWVARVAAVSGEQWDDPTPCTQGSGQPRRRGGSLDRPTAGRQDDSGGWQQVRRDVLGKDPAARAPMAAEEAKAIVEATIPGGGRVHLSYGEEDTGEYVRQLCADHLIHGWDLAAAICGDTSMDPHLVAEVGAWFAA